MNNLLGLADFPVGVHLFPFPINLLLIIRGITVKLF